MSDISSYLDELYEMTVEECEQERERFDREIRRLEALRDLLIAALTLKRVGARVAPPSDA